MGLKSEADGDNPRFVLGASKMMKKISVLALLLAAGAISVNAGPKDKDAKKDAVAIEKCDKDKKDCKKDAKKEDKKDEATKEDAKEEEEKAEADVKNDDADEETVEKKDEKKEGKADEEKK